MFINTWYERYSLLSKLLKEPKASYYSNLGLNNIIKMDESAVEKSESGKLTKANTFECDAGSKKLTRHIY